MKYLLLMLLFKLFLTFFENFFLQNDYYINSLKKCYYYTTYITHQKREVCAQLFDLEKCFKVFYVNLLKKENPSSYFPFSFRATLSFLL